MAGTTILSGSLITCDPFISTSRRPLYCTIDSVMATVKGRLSGGNEAATKQRSVLLVYSLYSLLMDSARYADKFLLPLHDPEGLEHGFMGVGDIAISDENSNLFECIQIIPGVSLTPALVKEAFARVLPHDPRRFCLLTTAEPYSENTQAIRRVTDSIYHAQGCEMVVDGLLPALEYSLRLVTDSADFLAAYSQSLQEYFAARV